MNNKNINYLVFTLVGFFLVSTFYLLVGAYNNIKLYPKEGEENFIEVTGEGEVFAKPDIALVSFSVENEEDDADVALLENAKRTNTVIAFLKNNGIEEKDIKTTNFNLYPRYEYHSKELDYYHGEKRVLAGYEVLQTVEVKIREMGDIGNIVDGAVKNGANRVSGMSFIIENEEELKKEARQIAIDKAKEEAETIAKQLGVKLSNVIGFTEQQTGGATFMRSLGMGEMDMVSPEIATGENRVSSRIYLKYQIK
jgi:uncharacterized protein